MGAKDALQSDWLGLLIRPHQGDPLSLFTRGSGVPEAIGLSVLSVLGKLGWLVTLTLTPS